MTPMERFGYWRNRTVIGRIIAPFQLRCSDWGSIAPPSIEEQVLGCICMGSMILRSHSNTLFGKRIDHHKLMKPSPTCTQHLQFVPFYGGMMPSISVSNGNALHPMAVIVFPMFFPPFGDYVNNSRGEKL